MTLFLLPPLFAVYTSKQAFLRDICKKSLGKIAKNPFLWYIYCEYYLPL